MNGEYYLDSCVNDALLLGYNCRLFEVDHYVSWGHLTNTKLLSIGTHVLQNGTVTLLLGSKLAQFNRFMGVQ